MWGITFWRVHSEALLDTRSLEFVHCWLYHHVAFGACLFVNA